MKKGQIGVEFLFAIGAVLLLFLIVLAFSISRRTELLETKSYLETKDECLRLSNLISSVYNGRNGLTIDSKTKYTINVYASAENKGEILVESLVENYEDVTCFYIANLQAEIVLNGNFQIRNENGVVVLENVV